DTARAYTNNLHVVYGEASLGLNGQDFAYLSSYARGGLESLKITDTAWVYRTPTPTLWRGTTDNEPASGSTPTAAQEIRADMFTECVGIHVPVDDPQFDELPIAPINNQFSNQEFAHEVKVAFDYETITTPATKVKIIYNINDAGNMTITMHYFGKKGLPPLPVIGMRFIMPTKAKSFDYTGLSGETYPDRMAGAERGTFHIDGLPVTKYLVPQENGMHMQTNELVITRNSTQNNADKDGDFSLKITQTKQPFNFSLLPYTAEELENATHIEELPLARRTVLVIAGAVRGVGGIDSWGADVEDQYQIDPSQDHEFSFRLN